MLSILDPGFWIGLGLGAVGIALTIYFRRRSPNLVVSFSVPEGDPARLVCDIENNGGAQARDVVVAFGGTLPLATRLYANAELGAELVEVEKPPQIAGPVAQALRKNFSVRIPRVAARDRVQFELHSEDSDNGRASEQTRRMRVEAGARLHEFGLRVLGESLDLGKLWDTDLIMDALVKKQCFFSPIRLSYERGRFEITILSDNERLADAHHSDLYSRFKRSFADIFEGGSEYVAPVIRVSAPGGQTTVAIFPPYVNASLLMTVTADQLPVVPPGQIGEFTMAPPVPDSYGDWDQGSENS